MARFGRRGSVWSATVVAAGVAGVHAYALAYVDLVAGPRILARVRDCALLDPGTDVEVLGTDDGNVVIAEVSR